jgi:hypothetical protein
MHLVIPPKYAEIQVVNRIKVNTSRRMKQKFSFTGEGVLRHRERVEYGVLRQYGRSRRSGDPQLVAMQGREDAGG